MDKHAKNAIELIEFTQEQIKRVMLGYQEALYNKNVPVSYLIEYKNFFENLRSALDYLAHSLFERFGASKKKNPLIYFPYVPAGKNEVDYRKECLFEKKLPGVARTRPDVADFILSFSWYNDGMGWFSDFMKITNTKKHVNLVPQLCESGVSLEVPGISITAYSISFGESGSIRTDAGDIKGPFEIQAGVPITSTTGKQFTPQNWRALLIEGYPHLMEADTFAEHCVKVIGSIVQRLHVDPI